MPGLGGWYAQPGSAGKRKNQMKAVPLALVLGLGCVVLGSSLPAIAAAQPVEIREGVLFEKNVAIPTDDGAFMMYNVFRPGE